MRGNREDIFPKRKCPKSGVTLTSCASYIIQGGGNDI